MRVLDLFSGIGGFSLGLEAAGMETVAFCEFEDFPRKVLAKHWPDVPCYPDVRTLTKEVLDEDGITDIDVISAGFPCQDISFAGPRRGIHGERSGLFSEVIRLVGVLRPEYVVCENVTAILTGDQGRWFSYILTEFSRIGYDCEWESISASEVGLTHERDRAWIIAYPISTRQRDGNDESRIFGKKRREAPMGKFRRMVGSEARHETIAKLVRKDDGVPNRAHRLKALGNAVVPQIPEMIGRAIMAAEA